MDAERIPHPFTHPKLDFSIVLAKNSIFDAADGLGLDNLKDGQLLIFTNTIPLRAAILRPDRNKQLHIIGTLSGHLSGCGFFHQRRDFCAGDTRTGGRENLRRLVRGLLQLPNMTMEFHHPVDGQAGSGSRRFCGSKIFENFCGVFVLLCYIPAPVRNRN